VLGEVHLACRHPGEPWHDTATSASSDARTVAADRSGRPEAVTVSYARDSAGPGGIRGLDLTERFALEADSLVWTLRLANRTDRPLETLIAKRAAFIARRQQHRDPAKWYDGLFSLWDVRMPEGKNRLGPENLGGQPPYAVSGSDDPSNGKCLLLSEKNVVYPDARQIEALEYFLEHFVWGKHQRTDRELPHPYGIYGCDDWRQCRTSKTGLDSGGHGQERMWRTFDYTTYFALYYNMYRIARQNPGRTRYLDADGYLRRAYGTARAFFEVPYAIRMQGWAVNGWCDWAFKIGAFHEKYLLAIIACRGWLETSYYQLGSDFRGCGSAYYNLSYMSQMGGRAILDQAVRFGAPQAIQLRTADGTEVMPVGRRPDRPGPLDEPTAALVRLGYASMLSSWALVNSGPAEKGYGFWRPGALHDGAAAWAFMPQQFGVEWNPACRGIPRGPWPVDGEIDHGLTAGIEGAATVVADDPIFGLFAFGGQVTLSDGTLRIEPRDGVRQRLHVLHQAIRLHAALDRDRFAAGRPILLAEDSRRLELHLENANGTVHQTTLEVEGLAPGV
jgi:hypothetical protein